MCGLCFRIFWKIQINIKNGSAVYRDFKKVMKQKSVRTENMIMDIWINQKHQYLVNIYIFIYYIMLLNVISQGCRDKSGSRPFITNYVLYCFYYCRNFLRVFAFIQSLGAFYDIWKTGRDFMRKFVTSKLPFISSNSTWDHRGPVCFIHFKMIFMPQMVYIYSWW